MPLFIVVIIANLTRHQDPFDCRRWRQRHASGV